MWEPHFDVLSQKRAGSYRKSLMFKTCQAGGLTKVSSTPPPPQTSPRPPKNGEDLSMQAWSKQNRHLGVAEVEPEGLQLWWHNTEANTGQQMWRRNLNIWLLSSSTPALKVAKSKFTWWVDLFLKVLSMGFWPLSLLLPLRILWELICGGPRRADTSGEPIAPRCVPCRLHRPCTWAAAEALIVVWRQRRLAGEVGVAEITRENVLSLFGRSVGREVWRSTSRNP